MTMKNPHAVALGKLGGGKTSVRKSKSSRENGKLGGRPPQPPTATFLGSYPCVNCRAAHVERLVRVYDHLPATVLCVECARRIERQETA